MQGILHHLSCLGVLPFSTLYLGVFMRPHLGHITSDKLCGFIREGKKKFEHANIFCRFTHLVHMKLLAALCKIQNILYGKLTWLMYIYTSFEKSLLLHVYCFLTFT